MLRAPEVEALYGGYALIEPRDPRVDGSTVLLVGSTAFPRSLLGHIAREGEWGEVSRCHRIKTLWIKKQSSPKQKKISDDQRPSGDKRKRKLCSMWSRKKMLVESFKKDQGG
jgi:hypothetical protein